jgi:Na+/glutamate symporter
MNTTGLPAYTADAETIAQEDFEIAVNLATGAAIVAFPLAFLGVVGVMVRRRLRQRGTITEERLLEGDEYGQLDGK